MGDDIMWHNGQPPYYNHDSYTIFIIVRATKGRYILVMHNFECFILWVHLFGCPDPINIFLLPYPCHNNKLTNGIVCTYLSTCAGRYKQSLST